MDLDETQQLAHELMDEHGLLFEGWRFEYDNAKQRFGRCSYRNKVISLSKHLVELNDEGEVRDTILHEIAHALAGPKAGHGYQWRAKCIEVGARPERCYDDKSVAAPAPNFIGVCPNCDRVVAKRYRIKQSTKSMACGHCCNDYNDGEYTTRFKLEWHHNDSLTTALLNGDDILDLRGN